MNIVHPFVRYFIQPTRLTTSATILTTTDYVTLIDSLFIKNYSVNDINVKFSVHGIGDTPQGYPYTSWSEIASITVPSYGNDYAEKLIPLTLNPNMRLKAEIPDGRTVDITYCARELRNSNLLEDFTGV